MVLHLLGEEFEIFMKRNGIWHSRTTLYHLASKEQVESGTNLKEGLKWAGKRTLETKSCVIPLQNNLHKTTGVIPAELLFGHRLRTHLDLWHADLPLDMQTKQDCHISDHNKGTKDRQFELKDLVYVRDLPSKPTWILGIFTVIGPQAYTDELNSGVVLRHHVDNLRARSEPAREPTNEHTDDSVSVHSDQEPVQTKEHPADSQLRRSIESILHQTNLHHVSPHSSIPQSRC